MGSNPRSALHECGLLALPFERSRHRSSGHGANRNRPPIVPAPRDGYPLSVITPLVKDVGDLLTSRPRRTCDLNVLSDCLHRSLAGQDTPPPLLPFPRLPPHLTEDGGESWRADSTVIGDGLFDLRWE